MAISHLKLLVIIHINIILTSKCFICCLIMYILYFAIASLSIILLLKIKIFYPSSSQL